MWGGFGCIVKATQGAKMEIPDQGKSPLHSSAQDVSWGATAMFAPKIPQTATKEAGTPSRTQANQSSHPLEKRFGRSPADQIVLLQRSIGNQSVLRLLARHGANNTPNAVRPSPLWDFSKIPIFPPGHPDRPPQGFPILA